MITTGEKKLLADNNLIMCLDCNHYRGHSHRTAGNGIPKDMFHVRCGLDPKADVPITRLIDCLFKENDTTEPRMNRKYGYQFSKRRES